MKNHHVAGIGPIFAVGALLAGAQAVQALPLTGQTLTDALAIGLVDQTDLSTGTVECSGALKDYVAEKAFGDTTAKDNTFWMCSWNSEGAWISYTFPEETVVNAYTIRNAGNWDRVGERAPRAWSLSGLNDDGEWVVLDSRTAQKDWGNNRKRSYVFVNAKAYRSYRLDITENNGSADRLSIDEIELCNVLSTPGVLIVVGETTETPVVEPTYGTQTNVTLAATDFSATPSLEVPVSPGARISYTCRSGTLHSFRSGIQTTSDTHPSFTLAADDSAFLVWNYEIVEEGPVSDGFVRYVAQNGNDANDGITAETPLASIKTALSQIVDNHPGVIHVLPGVYTDIDMRVDKEVKILGTTGDPADVVLRYSADRSWNSGHISFDVQHDDVVIANLTMEGNHGGQSEKPATVRLAAGGTLSNCVIRTGRILHAYRRGCVRMTHAKARVTRCRFTKNTCEPGDTWWHSGYQSGSGICMSAGLVDNCIFDSNSAVSAPKYPWASTVFMDGGTLVNCSFFNNTGNKAGGVTVSGNKARVLNTVFFGNGLTANPLEGETGRSVFSENAATVFVNCASDDETAFGVNGIAGLTAEAFKDYANGDCRLRRGALINTGTTEGVPAEALQLDFIGNRRVFGKRVDIGALESQTIGLYLSLR